MIFVFDKQTRFEEILDNARLVGQLNSLHWAPIKVVTSRPTSAPIVVGALELELEPYSLDDILQIVTPSAPTLADYVRDHEDIALLMETPLLCELVLYLHSQRVRVSDLCNRAEVIDQLIRLTPQNAMQRRLIDDAKPNPIAKVELDEFAVAVMQHYRSERRHRPFVVESESLQNSGWLRKVPASLGKFEFVHLNFLEYFASHGLVHAAPNALIAFADEHLFNTSVLGFLHHLLPAEQKQCLIDHVLGKCVERLTLSTSLNELESSDAPSYCHALFAVLLSKSEQKAAGAFLCAQLDAYHDASIRLLMGEIVKGWSQLRALFRALLERLYPSPHALRDLVRKLYEAKNFKFLRLLRPVIDHCDPQRQIVQIHVNRDHSSVLDEKGNVRREMEGLVNVSLGLWSQAARDCLQRKDLPKFKKIMGRVEHPWYASDLALMMQMDDGVELAFDIGEQKPASFRVNAHLRAIIKAPAKRCWGLFWRLVNPP
jgi:hypothetical protein